MSQVPKEFCEGAEVGTLSPVPNGVEAPPPNIDPRDEVTNGGFEAVVDGSFLPCLAEVAFGSLDDFEDGDVEDLGAKLNDECVLGWLQTIISPLYLVSRCNRSVGLGPKGGFGTRSLLAGDFESDDGELNGFGPLNTLCCCGSRVGNNVPSFPGVAAWVA